MWHSLIFLTKELFFQTSGRKLGWTRKKKYLSRVEFSHWYIRTKTEGGRTKKGSAHRPYLLPKNHPLKPHYFCWHYMLGWYENQIFQPISMRHILKFVYEDVWGKKLTLQTPGKSSTFQKGFMNINRILDNFPQFRKYVAGIPDIQDILQGVPEKNIFQRLLYISIAKKATKLMFILLERGIPSAHFDYRTASQWYLVTEI